MANILQGGGITPLGTGETLPTLFKTIAKNFKAIITAIDAVRSNLGNDTVIRSGSNQATISSGTDFIEVTINYTGFSATPMVVATAQHNSNLKITAKIQSKTATSAVIRVFTQANVTGQNATAINWIAIGK